MKNNFFKKRQKFRDYFFIVSLIILFFIYPRILNANTGYESIGVVIFWFLGFIITVFTILLAVVFTKIIGLENIGNKLKRFLIILSLTFPLWFLGNYFISSGIRLNELFIITTFFIYLPFIILIGMRLLFLARKNLINKINNLHELRDTLKPIFPRFNFVIQSNLVFQILVALITFSITSYFIILSFNFLAGSAGFCNLVIPIKFDQDYTYKRCLLEKKIKPNSSKFISRPELCKEFQGLTDWCYGRVVSIILKKSADKSETYKESMNFCKNIVSQDSRDNCFQGLLSFIKVTEWGYEKDLIATTICNYMSSESIKSCYINLYPNNPETCYKAPVESIIKSCLDGLKVKGF